MILHASTDDGTLLTLALVVINSEIVDVLNITRAQIITKLVIIIIIT